MILRKLVLSFVLLTSVFAPNFALSSTNLHSISEPEAYRALAQKAALDTSGFDSSYKLSLPNPVQDKNFYLLSLFQRKLDVRRVLSRSKALKQLAESKVLA